MLPRVIATVVLFLSIFFMPFWVSFIIALCAMMYFRYFFEALILFFIGDLMYGTNEPKFFGITFVLTLTACILFACVEFMKTRLKYYP